MVGRNEGTNEGGKEERNDVRRNDREGSRIEARKREKQERGIEGRQEGGWISMNRPNRWTGQGVKEERNKAGYTAGQSRTVRQELPGIQKCDGQTDGRTDGRTYRHTDRHGQV